MDKLSALVRKRQAAREGHQQVTATTTMVSSRDDVISPIFPSLLQLVDDERLVPRIFLSGKTAAVPSGDPALHYFTQQSANGDGPCIRGIRFVLTVGSNMKPPLDAFGQDQALAVGPLSMRGSPFRLKLTPVVLGVESTIQATKDAWVATVQKLEEDALNKLEAWLGMAEPIPGAADFLLQLPFYFVVVELQDNATGRLRDALPWTQLALSMFAPPRKNESSLIPTYWRLWSALLAVNDGACRLPHSPGILVHCLLGVSRSVSAVVAFVMERYRVPFGEALALVRRGRPIAQPNPCFAVELVSLERRLLRDTEAS